MAQNPAAIGPIGLFSRAVSTTAAVANRNARVVIILSLVLICGSFACAAAVQLWLDRDRALEQAQQFEARRSQEIAADLAGILDHYAALGSAFANAVGTAETSAALSEAGGRALTNIVVLNHEGAPVSELIGAPDHLLPLPDTLLSEARNGRTVMPAANGRDMVLLFPVGKRIVTVEIDLKRLLRPATMEETVVATRSGRVLSLGANWSDAPPMDALNLADGGSATRSAGTGKDQRLIGLSAVPGWPVVAGASIRASDALSTWYNSLPLFLFFILGPMLTGTGLASVFMREFEHRARADKAVRSLRTTPRDDARLLIRLADAERRAVEADRSKAEFISHMSHELRTPLNAIIGFSEVIAQGFFGDPGHPKYVEYANDIGAAGRHLHSKIGDVLDFANLEAGRHPYNPTSIDVSSIARQVVDELAGRAFSRRIRLTVSLAECAPALADPLAVKRILNNLLSNALQYTPDGSAVRVQVKCEPGAVVAAIQDGSIGFSPLEKDALGDAFTRFDRPGALTGVGMGLAIAMALARQMGGAVRLAGGPSEGTCAELRLPKA